MKKISIAKVYKNHFYHFVWTLFVLFGVLYLYFSISIAVTTAQTENGYDLLADVSSEIPTLEREYLETRSFINMSLAQSLGFVEKETIQYIKRDTVTAALTGNGF